MSEKCNCKKEYNGWSNYETWRVNLEMIDSISWVKEDFTSSENTLTVYDIASHLQSICEEQMSEGCVDPDYGNGNSLCYSYAMAFLSDVNWYEIAENLVENHPSLIDSDSIDEE